MGIVYASKSGPKALLDAAFFDRLRTNRYARIPQIHE